MHKREAHKHYIIYEAFVSIKYPEYKRSGKEKKRKQRQYILRKMACLLDKVVLNARIKFELEKKA
jgi:hypothetical protein